MKDRYGDEITIQGTDGGIVYVIFAAKDGGNYVDMSLDQTMVKKLIKKLEKALEASKS